MADVAGFHASAGALLARGGGLHTPPEVLLGWPRPNYVNPETRGMGGPVFLGILMGIALLVYLARMWARLIVAKNAGWDDILISCAMLPLIGLTVATVLGKHCIPSSAATLVNLLSYDCLWLPMAYMGPNHQKPCNNPRGM